MTADGSLRCEETDSLILQIGCRTDWSAQLFGLIGRKGRSGSGAHRSDVIYGRVHTVQLCY